MQNQLYEFKLLWNRIKYQNSYQSTFYLRADNKNKALEMMNTVFSNRKLPDSDWFRMTRDFCFYMVGFLIRIHTLGPRSIQKQHFWSILLNVMAHLRLQLAHLSPSWPIWAPSWPISSPSWPIWAPNWSIWPPSWLIWAPRWPIGDQSYPIWTPTWPIWPPSWPILAPNWPIWAPNWPIWAPSWPL